MTQYFARIDNDDCWGPFDSIHEPIAILKQASKDREHSNEQACYFFLHQSALEQVEIVNGEKERIRLGWLARDQSGRQEELSLKEEVMEISPFDKALRKRETDLAEAHFTLKARKAAEVNEGGLVDSRIP